MGLRNLLCRPFLFDLVMSDANADSQSAPFLSVYCPVCYIRLIFSNEQVIHVQHDPVPGKRDFFAGENIPDIP